MEVADPRSPSLDKDAPGALLLAGEIFTFCAPLQNLGVSMNLENAYKDC